MPQLAFDFTVPTPPPAITRRNPAITLLPPPVTLTALTPPAQPGKLYHSPHRPDIRAGGHGYPAELDTAILRWADAHPVVWHIVAHRKSQVYGLGSSTHIGWAQRDPSPEAVLERVYTMYQIAIAPHCYPDLWRWRLNFTLSHYHEPGFTGATFRTVEADGHTHGILIMDYTPATLEEVARHFAAWATPAAYVTVTHKKLIARWAWNDLRG